MRFKDYITELSFKTKIPIKIAVSNDDTFSTEFTVGEITYVFKALGGMAGHSEQRWEIQFIPLYGHGKTDIEGIPVEKKDLSHAKEVFSAVAKSLKMFIDKKSPFGFHFSFQTDKHKKLYERFAPMLAKAFPKYIYYKDFYKATNRHVFELDPKYWKRKPKI